MEFFDTINQVRTNWTPYKKWDIEQQKKAKQNENLRKKHPSTPEELEHAKQYGRTIVDVINTMDQYSIDKSEDAALLIRSYGQIGVGAGAIFFMPIKKLIEKIPVIKKNKKSGKYAGAIAFFLESAALITVVQILQAKYEKQASRIARYQTREHELKDSRHFVVYNEKQVKEAEEIAKTLPEVKDHKMPLKKGFNPVDDYKKAKKTTDILKADNNNYEEWKKEYLKEEELKKEKFKTLNPPKDELNKAEKDKEALLNTIKKIEASSLDYLNNMSMAISIAMAGTTAATYFGGYGMNKLLEKLQPQVKFLQNIPKLMTTIKLINVSFVPLVVPFILLGSTIKLEKDAARIGRFKAKQELLNNPENFIVYGDDKRKEVSDKDVISPKPKSFFEKIINDFKEVKEFKKDFAEYHNYLNIKHKQELKLDEALKQVDISDTQKREAIQLQKKAFHSFEKMDEKAQRFTDDTEAAVDIVGAILTGFVTNALRIWGAVRFANKALQIKNNTGVTNKVVSTNEMAKSMLPFVASFFIHPLVNIIGTRIKKDAGKIGVMTAMKDLDDSKNFLDEKSNNSVEG